MDANIHIVGAGIAGLITALNLEKEGFSPVIWEASSHSGGRLQSENIDGFMLDVGFQVLLESYPKAKKYLDYTKLDMEGFKSGAQVYINSKPYLIGNPLRDISFLWATITSPVGSFSDKLKIFTLNNKLKKKTIDKIFASESTTTLKYLKDYGFSNKIIANFFKPFFSGIFLETDLETSSRMFEFVFKMFGSGSALVPKKGISTIPNYLLESLTKTKINYNSKVTNVTDGTIQFEDRKTIDADYIVVATEPSALIENMRNQDLEWRSCENLYFKVPKSNQRKSIISLMTDVNSLINNFHFMPSKSDIDDVVSVTVLKHHGLSIEDLSFKIIEELEQKCSVKNATFLKYYHIKKALPILNNLQYSVGKTETQLMNKVFLAGDYMLNGSLNAAMVSGEKVAQLITDKIKGVKS